MSFLRIAVSSLFALALTSTSCGGSKSSEPGSEPGKETGSNGPAPNGASSTPKVTASLDGTWDITRAGRADLGPSELTVAGGVVAGVIATDDEGKTESGCKTLKDRTEFEFTIEGNSLSGTFTTTKAYEGDECPSDKSDVVAVSGSRKAATAGEGLSGEWQVQGEDRKAMIISVEGNSATVWIDAEDKTDGDEADITIAIAGSSATATSDRSSLAFAARRR